MLAGRTTARDAFRCMDTNDHNWSQPSQQKPATSQQSRTCWTFARPVPRYAVTVIYRNQQRKKQRFSVLRKKEAKPKTKKIMTTFGKSLSLTKYRMRYAIYMPPNTKDLAIDQTMVAYGNRQKTITLTWSNNSDLLWVLKHLMETRLYLTSRLTISVGLFRKCSNPPIISIKAAW